MFGDEEISHIAKSELISALAPLMIVLEFTLGRWVRCPLKTSLSNIYRLGLRGTASLVRSDY